MSDNQDNRPEDTNAAPAVPPVPPVAAASENGQIPPRPPVPTAGAVPGAQTPTTPTPPQATPGSYAPPQPQAPQTQPTQQTQPYPGAGFGIPAAAQPHSPENGTPGRTKTKTGAGKITALVVAAALVGGVVGLGGAWAGYNLWGPANNSAAAGPSVVTVNNTQSVNETSAIATKVVPSVVTINVSTSSGTGGTGSGVVLSKDGYILTNTHVVTLDGQSASPTISVTTSDGHIYQASIVGTDPVYDLAVIKLKGASNLTPITWGDSSALNVGDQTVAIGAPLGLSNTVTTGIVSALNRSIEIASSAAPNGDGSGGNGGNGNNGDNGGSPFFFDFGQGQQSQQTTESIKIAVIQTDAPINPGNSGGALVDSQGRLVGINVAIASTGSTSSSTAQSGSIGVGFSIPSDVAKRVADELIKDGSATHGLLGASVQDASSVQGATITGAYVVNVTSGGGAAKAGLQAGDIITSFNGVPITGAVDLTAQVRADAAGSTAKLSYVRDGRTQSTEVTLGTLK